MDDLSLKPPFDWIYKINLQCIENEDGSLNLVFEWDEKDPELQLWTELGEEKQTEVVLTALRRAANDVIEPEE